MTLISDTLHYRPDGTISGVTRVIRESYQTPSGRDVTEDVTSNVDLSAVTDQLGEANVAFDAHNKTLEQQIVDERVAAEDEKTALRTQHAESTTALIADKEAALAAKDAVIAEKVEALAAKDAVIAEKVEALAAKDAVIAEKDAALNMAVEAAKPEVIAVE